MTPAHKEGKGAELSGDVDVSDGEQPSQEEPSVTTGKEPNPSKAGNLVLSGPNKNITDSVKYGPFRSGTVTGSNAKLSPKRSNKSKKAPHRKHYMPSNNIQ